MHVKHFILSNDFQANDHRLWGKPTDSVPSLASHVSRSQPTYGLRDLAEVRKWRSGRKLSVWRLKVGDLQGNQHPSSVQGFSPPNRSTLESVCFVDAHVRICRRHHPSRQLLQAQSRSTILGQDAQLSWRPSSSSNASDAIKVLLLCGLAEYASKLVIGFISQKHPPYNSSHSTPPSQFQRFTVLFPTRISPTLPWSILTVR